MTTATEENLNIPEWTIGDRMTKALHHAGMGVGEMGEYLEVSRATIANWTSGRNKVSKQTLRLWALKTGVPLGWIENGPPVNDENPSGGEPEGQAWPATGSGPGCAPRDLNPEPIDSGSNVIPLFGAVAA